MGGGGYKTEMSLNITLTGDPADFGAYYCISKNEKGITRGGVDLFSMSKPFKYIHISALD